MTRGMLLGVSNTVGVLAGVFGNAATGNILQHGGFMIISGLYLVTLATYREKRQAVLGGQHVRASESPVIGHITN
ncbi:sodium-dependent phosphate transport protein 1, chloroplastic-like [Helianthus annuus]|uniref:sodium-dependent phosphate transport protein 1, chloroplastic-like n=1 Tax=Helianthus annuus TaxID=4232 RepID=UPI0016532B80|nr:sodium-dependent phosphate transport protein 1, chloroplastic-like [Helianthus annuus]